MKEFTPSPREVTYISVEIDSSTVPEPGDCLLCGSHMRLTPLEYVFPEREPIVKNNTPVDGYRCDECEAEYYPSSVSTKLFRATVPVLEELGEEEMANTLRERIARLQKAA